MGLSRGRCILLRFDDADGPVGNYQVLLGNTLYVSRCNLFEGIQICKHRTPVTPLGFGLGKSDSHSHIRVETANERGTCIGYGPIKFFLCNSVFLDLFYLTVHNRLDRIDGNALVGNHIRKEHRLILISRKPVKSAHI